jgi:hypothetical protein
LKQSEHHIFDIIYNYLKRYVYFPNDHYPVTLVAWILHTHFIDEAEFSPVLHISSETTAMGKTTLQNVLKEIVRNGEKGMSYTPAVMYRLMSKERPTLMIDQLDRKLEEKDGHAVLSMLEGGFDRSNPVRRVNMENGGELESFNTF